MTHFRMACGALVATLILLANLAALAEPAAEENSSDTILKTEIDPKAKAVVDRFSKFFIEVDGFKTVLNIDLKMDLGGRKQEFTVEDHIAAQRPNLFSLETESSTGGGAVVKADGENLWILMGAFNKYFASEAPKKLSDLTSTQTVMGIAAMGNAGKVTLALLSKDPAEALMMGVESLTYVGEDEVSGVKCDRIAGSEANMSWDLWIKQGDEPVVLKFVPDLTKTFRMMMERMPKEQLEQLGEQLKNMKAENVALYTKWEINPEIAPETFAFTAPEDATEVESFNEMLGQGAPSAGPQELLGKAAPDFTLELLDGNELKLADHKNKDVVILDFWASWCGPCRQAMPVIDEVAESYQDKGVKLYAVNIQEDADTIRDVLESDELNVEVAMDVDGEVARLYKANAIPQTVIIGKDGTVQVVHIGMPPEEQLREELDALLAGEVLAEPSEDEDDENPPVTEKEE